MNLIKMIEDAQVKENLTAFNVGDTVKVDYKVVEGTRERIQTYEGTVIKKQGEGVRSTFTVRRLSYGVGVERTFPMHSPRIENLTVTRKGKVRRARLFYLRDRQGKAAKVKEKRYY
jgi:large subunit ribosomal protein L19